MEKVLIATIGAPRYTDSTNESKDEQLIKGYQKTRYKFRGRSFESCYTVDALHGMLGFDKIILVGTARSEWYELYKYMFWADGPCSLPAENAVFDSAYCDTLTELFNNSNAYSIPPETLREMLLPLRRAIDHCVEIIILRPGMDEAEWQDNLLSLRRIEDLLDQDSELSIDITNGYRPLPIYEFLSLLYLKDVSRKNIDIGLVTYGFFDKQNRDDTVILDLSPMTDLLEYTRVIQEYDLFGTIHSFELVKDRQEDLRSLRRSAQQVLKKLSDVISFNDIGKMGSLINECKAILERSDTTNTPPEIRLLSDHIFRDITEHFDPVKDDEYLLQFKLALWHYEKKHYLNAITLAEECVISFAASISGRASEANDYKFRRTISGILSNDRIPPQDLSVKKFRETFNKIRLIRNSLAHPNGTYQDNAALRKDLKDNLSSICDCYQECFSPSADPSHRDRLAEIIKDNL